MYSAWKRMGFPVSEETQKRFSIDRVGGLQKHMYEEGEYNIRSLILTMAMQRNKTCLETASKMAWDIFVTHWIEKGNLYDSQKETISALYDIFFNNEDYVPTSTEVMNFASVMLQLHSKMDHDDEAYEGMVASGGMMFSFIQIAIKIRAIPISSEFDYARTSLQIKISGIFMKVDKPELLHSLINSMYESNLVKKEFVQAALSLGLLAKTYEWNDSYYLPACEAPKFPAQSEFKRKEALFKLMASNFVKGGKVDQAIDIYNELLSAYQKYNFDLNGLSFCHGELCKAYRLLESTGRLDPSYFFLNFIGSGFPDNVRGKRFIHEDQPFMHITSFIQKLTRVHVGSRIITNEDEAKRLAAEPQVGKYLFVKTVSPRKSLSESSHLTYMTRKFIDNKNLSVFVSTRRIPGSTNICDLWTEEVTYETEVTFPTLMNFSTIKNSCTVKITPIKNAIKSLMEKNSDLKGLEYLLKRNLKEGIDPQTIAGSTVFSDLSRVLAGTVDSPVNGGVGQYRAFFTLDSSDPEYKKDVLFLKSCFTDLIVLLDKLLKLHGALIPPNLVPQHSAMVELFSKNFKIEVDELKLDVNAKLNLKELVHNLIKANIRTHRHMSPST
ncbi:unnamed protein product [Ambrosiozyma monospora]|uniref:Unnamed protein product n=1 Tax=Ambrosiozyma monospora TaxID=43982 RepID=A0A9W6YZG5_AMBMO|nr:unnamed protein product [Ambrosiozyma monospora]